jgi:hypothetical protein
MRYLNPSNKKLEVSKNRKVSIEELLLMISKGNELERVILASTGLCGMRKGEVMHMRPSWLITEGSDFKKYGAHIKIMYAPQECDCIRCQFAAYRRYRQSVEAGHHNIEWYKQVSKDFYDIKPVKNRKSGLYSRMNSVKLKKLNLRTYWIPKTPSGERRIPLIPLAQQILTNYYSKHKQIEIKEIDFWWTVNQIGKRVLDKRIYPHSMRATYGTILANSMSITSAALKRLMGWSNLTTADNYIESDMYEAMKVVHKVSGDIFKSAGRDNK